MSLESRFKSSLFLIVGIDFDLIRKVCYFIDDLLLIDFVSSI